jgi:hypothetical protein
MMRVLMVVAVACVIGCQTNERHSVPQDDGHLEYIDGRAHYSPSLGFIPDSVTAIAVAEALMRPIVGVGYLREQRPLGAALEGGVWVVRGSLPAGAIGAVAVLELARSNAAVMRFAVE